MKYVDINMNCSKGITVNVITYFILDHLSLPSARQVEKFQEKGYQELRAYIGQTFPENNDRFPKLLLRYNLEAFY